MAVELDSPINRNYIQTLELLAGQRQLPAGHAELVAWLNGECSIPALNLGQSVYEENRLTIIVLTIADRLAAKAVADMDQISATFHATFQRHLANEPLPPDFPRPRPNPNEPMYIQILDMETVAAIDAHEKIKDHNPKFASEITATFAAHGIAYIETLGLDSHIVLFRTDEQLTAALDAGLDGKISAEFLRHLRPHDPTKTLTASALTISYDTEERLKALFGDNTHYYFR